MTTPNFVFTLAGAAALLVGLVTLLRPALIRRLLGAKNSEPARYALLIAGMMMAAFGLLLAGFAIGFTTARPLDMNMGAAR